MIQLPLQSAKQCSVTHMLGEELRGKTAEKPKVKISLCCCCGGGLSGLPLTTFCSSLSPSHSNTLTRTLLHWWRWVFPGCHSSVASNDWLCGPNHRQKPQQKRQARGGENGWVSCAVSWINKITSTGRLKKEEKKRPNPSSIEVRASARARWFFFVNIKYPSTTEDLSRE